MDLAVSAFLALPAIGSSTSACSLMRFRPFRWTSRRRLFLRDAALKATALTELGERQVNATARNYYLTAAQFLIKN